MLNTEGGQAYGVYTVFYSYLACFVNTLTLNMYVTGLTRRNTECIFVVDPNLQRARLARTNFSVGLFSSMPLCECEMC